MLSKEAETLVFARELALDLSHLRLDRVGCPESTAQEIRID